MEGSRPPHRWSPPEARPPVGRGRLARGEHRLGSLADLFGILPADLLEDSRVTPLQLEPPLQGS